ncbi:MAG: ABC transporter substrate-binding protein, partial [Anaerolineae bacterium]|nr:ABC transporter substrate-binding protein [Anaerolineae bacterium]
FGLCVAAAVVLLGWLLLRSGVLGRDRTWTRIHETGIWRVGMDPSFPPFENLDVATGRPVGFDVDLAEAIARRWGVRVEFVGVGFDQLLDAVAAHRVDSALSALPIMPHRTREVRFSEPYIEAGLVLVAPVEKAADLAAIAAPRGEAGPWVGQLLAGRRLAVEWGSEGDALGRTAQAHAGTPIQLLLRDSPEAALAAVSAGEADAAIVDAISLALYNRAGKRLALVGRPLRSDPYAIIVPADAPDLLRAVNDALAALRADGTLASLKARWLEEDAP